MSEKTITRRLKKIERATEAAIKSKKILMGQLKDNLSDKLDAISDQVDDLKDEKEINAQQANDYKRKVKRIKSQLDVDLDD